MPPSESALSALGLTLAEAHPDVEVWPDNVQTVNCFIALSTQWKVGMNGVTGLDYAAVLLVMDLFEVDDKKEVFSGLQMMEVEALKFMRSISS
ncbi:DUF1799 domain-containing protein [Solimicrobium silvestre]|uniref:Uncharacterized protein n=1 Tax=Solimicrobium silvestre TaxID=2099400 RepID=A0A2S9GZC4_9BURK|nr:DUF1799 domain-containing protein [Solimicrobium silvestre]PRC93089.1 Phage related hypothetical protein (DUF1799) [Solimicrobium silvestre]